jgi:hypothetical protein
LGCINPFHNFDRRVVLGYLLRLPSGNVEQPCRIISSTRNHFVPFLHEKFMNAERLIDEQLTLFQQTLRTGPWWANIAFP